MQTDERVDLYTRLGRMEARIELILEQTTATNGRVRSNTEDIAAMSQAIKSLADSSQGLTVRIRELEADSNKAKGGLQAGKALLAGIGTASGMLGGVIGWAVNKFWT